VLEDVEGVVDDDDEEQEQDVEADHSRAWYSPTPAAAALGGGTAAAVWSGGANGAWAIIRRVRESKMVRALQLLLLLLLQPSSSTHAQIAANIPPPHPVTEAAATRFMCERCGSWETKLLDKITCDARWTALVVIACDTRFGADWQENKVKMGGRLTWHTATPLHEDRDKLPNWSWVLLPPPSPLMLLSLSIHATAQGSAVNEIILINVIWTGMRENKMASEIKARVLQSNSNATTMLCQKE
jgi:hypothetical protein